MDRVDDNILWRLILNARCVTFDTYNYQIKIKEILQIHGCILQSRNVYLCPSINKALELLQYFGGYGLHTTSIQPYVLKRISQLFKHKLLVPQFHGIFYQNQMHQIKLTITTMKHLGESEAIHCQSLFIFQ